METTKECRVCGAIKPSTDFWGKARVCKPCICEQKRQQYQDPVRRAKIRAQQRDFYVRAHKGSRGKAKYWENPEQAREAMRLRRKNDPHVRVREKLAGAVRHGRIKKPTICSKCLRELGKRFIQAHHKDYTKPLEVLWLCASCHGLEHRTELGVDV